MYPAQTTRVTPRSSSQTAIASSRASRLSESSAAKTAVSIPAASARSSARTPGLFEATQAIGRPASISACRYVPSPLTRTPITRARSVRSQAPRRDPRRRRSSNPEIEDPPELLFVDVPRQPVEDGRARPGVPVDLGPQPVGHYALEVASDSAAGDMRQPTDVSQRSHLVEVEARGCEQIVALVVLLHEDPPDERETVGVDAGRREPDHRVAFADQRTVDQPVTLDEADAGSGEIQFLVPVGPGELGGLAADERDARRAADFSRAFDELRDLLEVDPVGGHVVEQKERLGPGRQDVVDAVRGEVGAAVA